MTALVESRIGAVAWGLWPTPRFLSPLIELDVPISGIQLSDWLHRKAHGEEDRPQASSAAGFPLRLSTQQSRTGPVIDGVLRLIANHLDLPIFESTPEVRVLCSAGITQHHCSYDPVRLPPEPPPIATLRPLPSLTTGLPRLPEPPFRRAVPTTPADRVGARVDYFPTRAAIPK